MNFYRKNINDNIGNLKGINSENFIVKIKEFLENLEDLLKNIKDKLLKEVGEIKNIVDKIIKGKRINKNAYDFIDTIFDYIKELIKKKILFFIKNK